MPPSLAETAGPRDGASPHHAHRHEAASEAPPAPGARRADRSGLSPLWWSVPRRLAIVGLLVVLLWIVIAWAVA